MSGKEKPQAKPEPRYAKEQIMESTRFELSEKDILAALLDDDKTYTLNEAAGVIDTFKKKEVK